VAPLSSGASREWGGVTDAPAPERFRIAMAALDLLCEFAARRVQSDPIVLLAAARTGYPVPYAGIYSRDGLAWREREMASVAMLTAPGGREPRL
jgi:hypothetical protein